MTDDLVERRFWATFDACEGVPTEQLSPGLVKELVEALEKLVTAATYSRPNYVEHNDALFQAREALAKMRPEAPEKADA